MVKQSLLPESLRLTLPEAVDLLVIHTDCGMGYAREVLERAIRDLSLKVIAHLDPDGSKISINVKIWQDIDWEGGLVDYEAPWSGSPPTILSAIPFLSREEFLNYFKISDASPTTGKTGRGG